MTDPVEKPEGMSRKVPETKFNRLLVVCVDGDDDIGVKAKVKTPVVGKESCIAAASALALADPEEADANAIFAAIKEYEELKMKGYQCDIAVISGRTDEGIEADEKIRSELREVSNMVGAEGAVLVSDGSRDESVFPILQTVIPIISLRRVVIKHSQRIEESYEVLGRYLRMLAFDPKYSRYTLGLPGLLLVITGVFIFTGLVREAITVILGIIGAALMIRGFDLDKLFSSLTKIKLTGQLRLFTILASSLIVLSAFLQGFANLPKTYVDRVSNNPSEFLLIGHTIIGHFMQGAIILLWIGLATNLAGASLVHWLRRSMGFIRDVVGIVILGLLYLPVYQFSLILTGQGSPVTLFLLILTGLALAFVAILIVYEFRFSRRGRVES